MRAQTPADPDMQGKVTARLVEDSDYAVDLDSRGPIKRFRGNHFVKKFI